MNSIFYLFLIISSGYLFGRIRFKGIGLGISVILLVALVFGHFGVALPAILKNLGLACFVAAVGHISGPTFFDNFKKRALSYIFIGFMMVLTAVILCAASIRLFDLPVSLSMGLLAGALSSTPCLAAASEVSQDALTSVGYGIAYPFGVVGVVVMVQIISKIIKGEYKKTSFLEKKEEAKKRTALLTIDSKGLFFFAMSIWIGTFIGDVKIPLPGGLHFSLGISGGVLFSGLVFGSLDKIGHFNCKVNRASLETLREFGLSLFLAGAGTEAGQGFVSTISEYGIVLFLIGMFMTIIPILVGFVLAYRYLKLDVFSSLGSVCGGMTSTPALGSLAELDGYDNVASGYAATYSVALICLVISVQIIFLLFS